MCPGHDRVHGGDSLHGSLNSGPKVAELFARQESFVMAIFRQELSGALSASASSEPSRTVALEALESTQKFASAVIPTRYTYEKNAKFAKSLWTLDRPIVQLENFRGSRALDFGVFDAKLERRSRLALAHKARHGFESHFRVVAVTPLRAGTPHASLGKPQDTRSFRRSPCRLLPLTKPPRRAPRPGPTSPASAVSPAPPR